MKAIVLTGWHGTGFGQMAAHTLPLMEDYAGRHGIALSCVNLAGPRPPSWMKIAALHEALQEFDLAVWLDADVVVMDQSVSIAGELRPGSWQALVEHDTPSGRVPNCGVWVLTQDMLPTLEEIWHADRHIHHPWWEQAAILERMGYTVTDDPYAALDKPTTLYERTTFLSAVWNHHPYDERRVSTPRFVHATQYADRVGECRRLAEIASQGNADG